MKRLLLCICLIFGGVVANQTSAPTNLKEPETLVACGKGTATSHSDKEQNTEYNWYLFKDDADVYRLVLSVDFGKPDDKATSGQVVVEWIKEGDKTFLKKIVSKKEPNFVMDLQKGIVTNHGYQEATIEQMSDCSDIEFFYKAINNMEELRNGPLHQKIQAAEKLKNLREANRKLRKTIERLNSIL